MVKFWFCMMQRKFLWMILVGMIFSGSGCSHEDGKVVVAYVSVDQEFAEPILKKFERESGIRVQALYDVEANKSIGLANRLLAERGAPMADVFWNSELIHAIRLKEQGVLSVYFDENAKDLPESLRDRDGTWTGFAARTRVLLYDPQNRNGLKPPHTLTELTDPIWQGQVALSIPLIGTAADQFLALCQTWGKTKTFEFYDLLKRHGAKLVQGNSLARDLVLNRVVTVANVDTDDAYSAQQQRPELQMIYPTDGTLLIPNTVMLIQNAPHSQNGKCLIHYLLSREVETQLAYGESMQIPLRHDVKRPAHVPFPEKLTLMKVDYSQMGMDSEPILQEAKNLFILTP